MTTTIQLKRSNVTGYYPGPTSLALGELAINTFDGRLFFVKNNGTASVIEIATSQTLASNNYLPAPSTPVTPATATKVSYNQYGLITSGTTLVASDIPSLPWSQLTNATLPTTISGYGITDAASLVVNNNFTGLQTITSNALRLSGWNSQSNDGMLYMGSGNNFIYKNGSQFTFNIAGGFTAALASGGTIYTTNTPQTTALTQSATDNSTNIATTAFVKNAVSSVPASSIVFSKNVVKLQRGTACFFIQTADSKIYAGGYGGSGDLGTGNTNAEVYTEIQFPSYLSAYTILDFTIQSATAYVLFSNNELYGWGLNAVGELGLGAALLNTLVDVPTKLATGVAQMYYAPNGYEWEYGTYNSMYYKSTTGAFFACGDNSYGELATGNTTNASSWQVLPAPTGKTILNLWVGTQSVGKCVFCQTTDYFIYGIGQNAAGELGIGNGTQQNSWVNISFFNAYNTPATAVKNIISTGRYWDGATNQYTNCTIILTGNGSIFTAGSNLFGQLGNGTTSGTPNFSFGQVTLGGVSSKTAVSITKNWNSVWALFSDGTYARWGYNGYGQLGNGTTTNTGTPIMSASTDPGGATASAIFGTTVPTGDSHWCNVFIVKPNGIYFCGYNDAGIAGIGSASVSTNITTMTPILLNNINVLDIKRSGTANYAACLIVFNNSPKVFGAGYDGNNELNLYNNNGNNKTIYFDTKIVPFF